MENNKGGQTCSGRDGVVRAADLTTLDRSQRIIWVKRPVHKVYPLEVSAADSDNSDKTGTVTARKIEFPFDGNGHFFQKTEVLNTGLVFFLSFLSDCPKNDGN